MNLDLYVLILVGGLTGIMVLFRTHAAIVTLVLSAGFVISTSWSSMVFGMVSNWFPGLANDIFRSGVAISLLILPALAAGYKFHSTMGKRWIQQVPPALIGVLFAFSMLLKLVPVEVNEHLVNNSQTLFLLSAFSQWVVLLALGVAIVELLAQHDKL